MQFKKMKSYGCSSFNAIKFLLSSQHLICFTTGQYILYLTGTPLKQDSCEVFQLMFNLLYRGVLRFIRGSERLQST